MGQTTQLTKKCEFIAKCYRKCTVSEFIDERLSDFVSEITEKSDDILTVRVAT